VKINDQENKESTDAPESVIQEGQADNIVVEGSEEATKVRVHR